MILMSRIKKELRLDWMDMDSSIKTNQETKETNK